MVFAYPKADSRFVRQWLLSPEEDANLICVLQDIPRNIFVGLALADRWFATKLAWAVLNAVRDFDE